MILGPASPAATEGGIRAAETAAAASAGATEGGLQRLHIHPVPHQVRKQLTNILTFWPFVQLLLTIL